MDTLKGFQKKHLKGLAHGLKPVVQIGKEGITEGVIRAVDEGLRRHELIKIKFTDFKDRKEGLTREIEIKTGSERVGMIGHMAILYRPQTDPEKRKITLPQRNLLKSSP
ncbi:MAG: ribosome assembly RNA-binding protein YhbY [Deltaproteobacteria bacterium]|nr:ribosome assembly RNA-binding protein YhbY [Deltaproteobacteria bacterium]